MFRLTQKQQYFAIFFFYKYYPLCLYEVNDCVKGHADFDVAINCYGNHLIDLDA